MSKSRNKQKGYEIARSMMSSEFLDHANRVVSPIRFEHEIEPRAMDEAVNLGWLDHRGDGRVSITRRAIDDLRVAHSKRWDYAVYMRVNGRGEFEFTISSTKYNTYESCVIGYTSARRIHQDAVPWAGQMAGIKLLGAFFWARGSSYESDAYLELRSLARLAIYSREQFADVIGLLSRETRPSPALRVYEAILERDA